MQRLIIIGAGGHGREVLDIVEAINLYSPTYDFLGFLDDGEVANSLVKARNTSVIGGSSRLADLEAAYLIGIGSGPTRRRIDALASAAGATAAIAIHPMASIGSKVRVGPGCVVAAGARLTTNIRLGRHVHINVNATVSHDCVIDDYATLSPGVHVSGNVRIHTCAMLGAGSSVIQGIAIGARTTVGAGAAVVRDLPNDVTAVGVPARAL